VDGEWTTNLRDRAGQPITLTLKSDGNKLTGTIHAFRTIPLEGSIEGNVLRVTLKVPATGGELLVNYIATLEGDELKFTYQSETGHPSPPFGPAARVFIGQRVK
jgi:hypothetical protein